MVAGVSGTLQCLAPGKGLSVKAPGHLEQKVSEVFSGLPAHQPAVPLVNSPWISCCLFPLHRGVEGTCRRL